MASTTVDLITEVNVTWKRKFVDNGIDFYAKMTPQIKTKIRLENGAKEKIETAMKKTLKEAMDGKTIDASKL